MANIFDQFDEQARPNAFDQFDPPKISVGEDVAKSVGAGLATATSGILGMGGDVRDLGASAADWLADKTGAGPEAANAIKLAGRLTPMGALLSHAPTSRDVINSATDPIVSPDYKPATTLGEYAKTGAEFAPGMLLGGPETALARFATNVAVPAIASETAGQLTKGTEFEPWARVGGAIVGGALPSAARRAVTPLPISAERQGLVDTLAAENIPVTAGQATGHKPLQWAESVLADTPGTGGAAAHAIETQAEAFTSAALRRAGIDAKRATPEVMDDAFRRIGADFDGVAQRNNVFADRKLGNDLASVEKDYNSVVSRSNRAPVVADTARDIGDMMAQNGGVLTGEQYSSLTSTLARQARNAKSDPGLQEALQGMRTALDDAMERSLYRTGNAADMQTLREARRQYRNILVLERAATSAGSGAAEGLISPSHLRNAVVQQGRRAYGRGKGDFADLARAGEALLKPLPNSGTSPRHNISQALHTIGAIAGGGAGAAAGPGGSLLGAAAGAVAPTLAGRVLLSRPAQAYFANQRLMPAAPAPFLPKAARNIFLANTSQGALASSQQK